MAETGSFHQFVVASVVLDEEVAIADYHAHRPSCWQGARDTGVSVVPNDYDSENGAEQAEGGPNFIAQI